ncbi:LEAF RUST 10 DISEASE-RESISTANCE LOCUS RECEPTOR-LIKE PROTEIN KINASE-like 2.1 isoform X2 [Salvia divinorum]|uniref:LEAF RUST 10 DISEASE-RESISTANCE LOCUS RECEPTOR-LIKE PROTEIN KINASE-like 2.1 isoform X2 n=1 Tax=Salvia divinorum TaxID=28513 RepID=A0ABD1FKF8_SALDI
MITTQKLNIFLAALILSLHFLHPAADAKECSPSSCGDIRDIGYPFGFKSDPSHCGIPEYELTCENNVTFLYLDSVKYYVKDINYDALAMRLVDASINNDDICSFPISPSDNYEFITPSSSPYYFLDPFRKLSVNLISCPNPLNNSPLFTDCSSNLSHPRFRYVHLGNIMASEVPHMCRLDLIDVISGPGPMDLKNVSLSQIHQSFLYGFKLNFCNSNCNEKFTIWGKLIDHLSIPHRYLLIPLAILGVSLPVTIIIGIAGVLLLSFTPTSSWEIQFNYFHMTLLGVSNQNVFIVFIAICVAITVCLTAALNLLLIIIIGAGVGLALFFFLFHSVYTLYDFPYLVYPGTLNCHFNIIICISFPFISTSCKLL